MLFRNLKTTVGTQFVGMAIGILTSIVINRALLPEGKGLLATFLVSIDLILAFTTFGLPKALIYHIGQAEDKAEVVANAMSLALANGLLAAMTVTVFASFQTGGVFEDLPGSIFVLAIPTGGVTTLYVLFESILRGLNQIWICNLAGLLRRFVYFGLPLLIVLVGDLTIELTVLAYVLSMAAPILLFYVYVRRETPDLRFNASIMGRFARYGLRYQTYSLVNYLHNRVDVLIVGFLLTVRQVGYYSTAVNMAQLVWNLPMAVSFVILPFVASQKNIDNAAAETARVTRITTVLLLGAGGVIALTAPWLVNFMYGDDYMPCVGALRVLMPGVVMYSIVNVTGAYLIGRNRLIVLTMISSLILIVNMAFNYLLIPTIGIEGAALSSTLTYTVTAVLLAWLVSREGAFSIWHILLPQPQDFRLVFRALERQLVGLRARGAALRS